MCIKVLIIDDDYSMTDLLGILLRSHGMQVISCNTGEQGISLARAENPNIILLDLLMPELDGWNVCKKLRDFTQTPIAILSALDDPRVISSALDAGADDYMIKPVANSVLIAHVTNLTRRYRVENDTTAMIRQFSAIKKQASSPNSQQKPVQA